MNPSSNPHGVKVGQVWEDTNPAETGRLVMVEEITDGTARLRVVANDKSPASIGRRTRARLDRFKPTSTGYRLIEDVKA